MANNFPRYEIDVEDVTPVPDVVAEDSPLHRPFFAIFAEKGTVGVPLEVDYSEAVAEFGSRTFDLNDAFYKHPTLFAYTAFQNGAKPFVMRVAPEDAAVGGLVLEARVYDEPITQYEKDDNGFRIVDASNNYIPATQADGTTILTEPGIRVVHKIRALTAEESYKSLEIKTVTEGGETYKVYPIVATQATSPGAFINYTGYRLYFSADDDLAQMESLKSLLFRFAPVSRNVTSGLVTPITDRYSNPSVYFSFNEAAIDKTTDRYMGASQILKNDYRAGKLPFVYKFYDESVKTLGEQIVTLDGDNDATLTSPYMANFLTGKNPTNQFYDHVMVDTTNGLLMSKDVIHYHVGGSDGTLTKTTLEDLTDRALSTEFFPEITDSARYPITHLYDSGYRLSSKKTLLSLMATRQDIKAIVSTQDVALPANDQAEDYSTGSSLRATALLYPESDLYSTPVCRASIFQQCGNLANSLYLPIVPLTLHSLILRCLTQSSPYLKGRRDTVATGSAITAFDSISWFPSNDDTKQASWELGLNYAQHYDTGKKWHFASIRSVYPIDTSLLSDDFITDIITYAKHIIRKVWSLHVGSHDKAGVRLSRIKKALDKAFYDAFGTYIRVVSNPYMGETSATSGQVTMIDATIYGNQPDRTWKVRVPVTVDEEAA